MQTLTAIFIVTQAVGAIIGAGGSVLGELSYFRAIRDGRIERAERDHLNTIAQALRFGMLLLLISSIALVLIDYIFSGPSQLALTSIYWSLMTFALVVITASWALARRKAPFWLASSAAFTSWWMIALLTLGRLPNMTYGATILFGVIAGAIIAAVLGYLRSLYPRG